MSWFQFAVGGTLYLLLTDNGVSRDYFDPPDSRLLVVIRSPMPKVESDLELVIILELFYVSLRVFALVELEEASLLPWWSFQEDLMCSYL